MRESSVIQTSALARPIQTGFRTIALVLNVGAWLWFFSDWGPKPTPLTWGGHWRFITFWSLTFNIVLGMQSLWAQRTGRPAHPSLVALCLPLTTFVLVMYWALYALDPKLLHASGKSLPWYIEYHTHMLTTVFVWVEATAYSPIGRYIKKELGGACMVAILYLIWIEFAVAPLSGSPCNPSGDVCGYPYPFLNALSSSGRILFYAGGIGLLGMFYTLGVALSSKMRTRRTMSTSCTAST